MQIKQFYSKLDRPIGPKVGLNKASKQSSYQINANLKDVPEDKIPKNGVYPGLATAMKAFIQIGIYEYDLDMDEGVRGMNIPADIHVKDGVYTVFI